MACVDTRARQLLLSWTTAREFRAQFDPVGNLFIRREGKRPQLAPVLIGSRLDMQPASDAFAGMFSVLAGLEALESMDDACVETERSVELLIWMSQRGSRFGSTITGSSVATGCVPLEGSRTVDVNGSCQAQTLKEQGAALTSGGSRSLGLSGCAYVEAHVERGPSLESEGWKIGIVSGIQAMCTVEIEIVGVEAHAGSTPRRHRNDAFFAAMILLERLRIKLHDPADVLRFTVVQFELLPGDSQTVPGRVKFTIDLVHPDLEFVLRSCEIISAFGSGTIEGCTAYCRPLGRSDPVHFAPAISEQIRLAAVRRKVPHAGMMSGAIYDAQYVSREIPTGMFLVPCARGMGLNQTDNGELNNLSLGAQVLSDTVLSLAQASWQEFESPDRQVAIGSIDDLVQKN